VGPVIQSTLLAAGCAVWTVLSAVPHSGTWLGTSVQQRIFWFITESLTAGDRVCFQLSDEQWRLDAKRCLHSCCTGGSILFAIFADSELQLDF